jgi:glycosyltransferase involved in cell wall biosynthesis
MSNEFPLVCICVPTYNAAGTVRETLESILSQTYRNLVVHISDNASTDDTIKIIESITDPRITIHRHEVNVGGEGNFNRCIQYAEGKYTAIFHADDLYEPDMVEKQVEFLELHPRAGAVFTEANLIDHTGNIFGKVKLPKQLSSKEHEYQFLELFKATLHRYNFFICPSAMLRTAILKNEIKCWRSDMFRSSSDLDVWLRVAQQHSVGLLRLPLMRYRISQFQFSAQVRQQTERADFFLVTDHYLAQEDVSSQLDETDLMHYQWLVRTDRVRRALSLFALNRVKEANKLCDNVLSLDAFHAAIDNRRSLLALLAAIYIRSFVVTRLHALGIMLLKRFRR